MARLLLRALILLAGIAVLTAPAAANPVTLTGYFCISNNSPSCSAFASAVSVTIFSGTTVSGVTAGANEIGFLFTQNAGFGVITTIGFADPGNLIGAPASTTNFTGTNFLAPGGCNPPGGVPGGNAFNFEDLLCADIVSQGGVNNGLNSGEMVAVVFALGSGVTLQDVLDAINAGTFSIGHHAQSLPDGSGGFGQSDAIVCCTTTTVPEPGTLVLLGAGLLGLAAVARRRLR